MKLREGGRDKEKKEKREELREGGSPEGYKVTFICIYKKVVDLRTVSFDVPPQEILTKDSVTVAVDAVVYYKVTPSSLLHH